MGPLSGEECLNGPVGIPALCTGQVRLTRRAELSQFSGLPLLLATDPEPFGNPAFAAVVRVVSAASIRGCPQ